MFAELDRTDFSHRFTRQSGPISIIAQARIDDRVALLGRLSAGKNITDEELILAAYARWGTDCPRHLTGDFAFIIIDRNRSQIFCARDHIGVRPFFYSLDRRRFAASTNLSDLVVNSLTGAALDPAVIATALADNTYRPTDRTFFRNIHKLPPGHSLTFDAQDHTVSRYWAPEATAPLQLADDRHYIEAGRELLDNAVADRLRGAKHPAVHLSGGLDSSAVAAVTANLQRKAGLPDPPAYAWYSAGPRAPSDSETQLAEAAGTALGLTLHAPIPTAERIVALLRADWTSHPDAANLIGEHAVLNHARSLGVDTILSGWGGDESLSFNGRGYHAELLGGLRLGELSALCEGRFPISLARGVKRGVNEYFGSANGRATQDKIADSYLRPELAQQVSTSAPPISFRSTKAAMAGLIECGALTARLEDWSMAGARLGIGYTFPLLDRRIMEFALSLPGHVFYRPGSRRWIMREILDPQLPDLVRYNATKLEPARAQMLLGIVHSAFNQCADLLSDCNHFGGREDYVDIGRLIRDLRAPKEQVMDKFSFKRRALQMLKF